MWGIQPCRWVRSALMAPKGRLVHSDPKVQTDRMGHSARSDHLGRTAPMGQMDHLGQMVHSDL